MRLPTIIVNRHELILKGELFFVKDGRIPEVLQRDSQDFFYFYPVRATLSVIFQDPHKRNHDEGAGVRVDRIHAAQHLHVFRRHRHFFVEFPQRGVFQVRIAGIPGAARERDFVAVVLHGVAALGEQEVGLVFLIEKRNQYGGDRAVGVCHGPGRMRAEAPFESSTDRVHASIPYYHEGMEVEEIVRARALATGFTRAGICRVEPGETVPHLSQWLQQQRHGTMRYMEDPRRLSPEHVLPGVRTMIVVTLNYRWPDGSDQAQEGMISRYAWAADYHRVMTPMLEELASALKRIFPGAGARVYVDTGPVTEKYWAQKAGVGWIGKHTNVLAQQGSSWFFIGVVLTDAQLRPDPPAEEHCGTCERCIEACPTRAITAPYQLDARLCISYLTIELRGSIPRELRQGIGHRIFGCDDCQDVCPWNRFAFAGDPRFTPRPEVLASTLSQYLSLTRSQFVALFEKTNVLRAKYRGFLRNCLVAAGNSGRKELAGNVIRHLNSEDEMLREHAAWALGKLRSTDAAAALQSRRIVESSPVVIEEIDLALAK